MDVNKFSSHLRRIYGDITFEEAFQKTGRILNIPVASVHSKEIPKLLNYVTAPNVVSLHFPTYSELIWSAVTASCALPAVFKSVYLMAKDKQGHIINWSKTSQKFRDGSIGADVPMKRLSELFNVNHFIVSQVNPHVAPFLTHTQPGSAGLISSFFKFIKLELKYRTNQVRCGNNF
jgi:TAG lipase/steryl ester hydrolase/phospholipase A2/LPA acyltransferase